MMYGKTIENVRNDLDSHATLLREELERASSKLNTTLVIVGALAAFAVVAVIVFYPPKEIPRA